MLEKILDPIFAPFRSLRAKVNFAKNVPNTIKGDIQRVGTEAKGMKNEAKGYAASAKGAQGKAQGAAKAAGGVQAPQVPKKKMGFFTKKKKCEGCGQKLHPSWDECPFCGFGKKGASGPGAPAPSAPGAAAPQRTMALDLNAAGIGAAGSGESTVGWIIPLDGAKTGELIQLKGRVTVGTSADNDIVIGEASISGHHCEFVGNAMGFKVNDLGSTNGTFVNDKKVQSHELIDNDNLKLGKIRFKYKSLS